MIEAGNLLALRPANIDIRQEIDSIIQQNIFANPSLLTRTISIGIGDDIPPIIQVDRSLVRALFNLIQNAFCLSCEDANIILSLSSSPYHDDPISSSPDDQPHNFFFDLHISRCHYFDVEEIHKSFHKYYNFIDENDSEDSQKAKMPSIQENLREYYQTTPFGSALGWYVAFNIIQTLGGLLRCQYNDGSLDLRFGICVVMFNSPESCKINFESVTANKQITDKALLEENLFTTGEEGHRHLAVGDSNLRRNDFSSIACDKPDTGKMIYRILVVDDSPICRKVAIRNLESAGYEVETADNGKVKPKIYSGYKIRVIVY